MNMRGVFARVSVGTIRLWVGAAVLILVVADISPAGAQSTEILRLSTLDETTSNPVGVSGGQQYAQSFCTGESEVTLSKVRLPTSSSSDSEPSVTIRAGGSGGPGETIDTLTNPETFDNFISTYEDFTSSGIELDANTSYWLVIHVGDGSDPLTFGVTESKLESSAEAGWSIGDKMLYQGSGGWSPAFASSEPSGYRMRMAVYARGAVPSMAPPIFTDRDCNGVADPLTLRVDENTAASTVVGPVTATDPDNDSLTYSVSGTDAAEFNQVFVINNGSGEITVKSGASPNYESKRSYSITVNVTDGKDASGNMEDPAVTDDSVTVTVRVNNIDEPGTVTLSQATPGVGSALRPTLDDPDGWVVLFKVQWSRADTADGAFTVLNFRYISSLRKASYTPGTADEGKFLKVTLFYIDRQCRVVNSYNNQCRRMAAKTADNAVATAGTNNAPVFSSSNVSRSIAENTAAGQNVGAVVTATDADAGDTLGYTLGGADAASFDFVESSGQIRTKSGVTYDFEAKSSYTVTVTASDGTATAVATVTIGVTDVDEPPSAPATPMVSAVSGSTTSLSVSWAAPANAGKPAIANYDVQYRAGSSGAWSDGPEDVAGTSATITSLVASTDYEARVRATNAEGDSGWSDPPGAGRTNTPTNNAPVFSSSNVSRSIAENTAAGQNVGAVVTATDADAGDTLGYTLGGADAASFDFVESSGQIRTKSGVTYDFEAKSSYTVTVTASDGTATAVATVTIGVTDVDEPPSAPATPMVSAVSGSTTSLSVSWAAPANAGKPAIANYDVQYRVGSSGAWSDGPEDVAGTSATITSLVASTDYEARVRATNAEGDSGWSDPPGAGRTNTPTNNAPVFSSSNVSRSIAENTAAGQNVGAVVTAADADAGDTLGYTLGGTDAASFDFVESSGQIRTKSGVTYDFEAKSSYTVTVTASDGTATAVATVTIGVTDVDEPPSAPATPMVSAVSGSTTSLSVSWAAPANAGKPAIANYDVQYRAGSSGAWSDGPEDVAGTSATITSLVASTDYEARVRATNAEGDSGWSDPPGAGRTNTPLPPGSGFLVGNFGQPVIGAAVITLERDIVGAFTAGALGAELHNIEFRLFVTLPAIDSAQLPSVTLYRGSVLGTRATTGTLVATLSAAPGSSRPSDTVQTVAFIAPGGTRLDADTTYLVVLTGEGSVRVESTTSPAEDAGGASGWTIDGVGAGSSSPYSYQTNSLLLMRVNGTAGARTPLTASSPDEPSSHDGQSEFTFELQFSEEPKEDFSENTLRDHAFTVTGGEVKEARSLVSGSNVRWEITINPASNGDVTIVLPITTDCTDNGAVCTGDSRKLSNRLELTVSGPGSQQSSQQQQENSAATGSPTISGTAQVGETLTASTTGITDADGLTNASYSYQWIANDGTSDSDIADATSSSYTLVAADAGKTIKVKVTFTDDNGNDESLTSTATTAVIAANTSATGAPTISGTVQVDQTLTADTSGIGDADGLTNVSYSYQWIANDGTSDSDIADGTSSSYTLVAADAGKTIKVKVIFTDDAQNQETGTSAATAAVAAAVQTPLTASIHSEPASHDGQDAFTFELHFSENLEGFSYKTLRDHAFTVTGGKVATAGRLVSGSNTKWRIKIGPTSNGDVTIVLPITTDCADSGAVCNGDSRKLSNRLELTVSGPGSQQSSQQQEEENSPATGNPTISGTAQVGETLTASTTGITDTDRLTNVSYSYQWIANDGTSDSDIADATASAYTLVAADAGKTIKVKVAFTDDNGNDESLTSTATTAVIAANTSATGAPTISGTVQVDQTLTADTSGIGDADGLTNVSYSYQWIANDGTSDSDIADATSSSYTLVAADAGKTIKVKVAFTDDAQNQETGTSAATAAVAAAVQTPLTASIHSEPASHDGQDAFTFELHFSENLEGFSYKTLRDHAFTVTGGKVATAGRLVSGNNTKWRIKIGPTSNGDVTIVLPITTDCADNGAVCNGDSRKLSNRLELTVSGPGS